MFQSQYDTICALSTPAGVGAIALIRMTGDKAIDIAESVFSKKLSDKPSHSVHYGSILKNQDVLDDVVLTIFRNPTSFTGEDLVEMACHGSMYIQQELIQLLLEHGARLAGPGEFSLRAFLNKKMDLSQTEAIADLIAAGSAASHKVAMHQMRGGFSQEIEILRQNLLDFASLIELELDFSQEDVEFADRTKLEELITRIQLQVKRLLTSFKLGNVLKNGVPVAIVGAPNAGKSTLLNALLNEEKAIVSEIAGTTRDVIEDTLVMDGIEFRFFDTAGIRDTTDTIESLGIGRALEKIEKARIVLLLFDLVGETTEEITRQIKTFADKRIRPDQTLICLFNKTDQIDKKTFSELSNYGLMIAAKTGENLEELRGLIVNAVRAEQQEDQFIVTNIRHYEILQKCEAALEKVIAGMKADLPGDLLAMDIREILQHLGDITGQVSNDELLGNIFGRFCIGK